MAKQVPTKAGELFGRALAYLDAPTLATWCGSSGFILLLSRYYARLFGFPELAAHRRLQSIREMLFRYGGNRVLDLGAGNGLYSVGDGLSRTGSSHFLADVSVRHMRRATRTGADLGLPLWGIACSAEALPLSTESVDTVLLIEVLQFVENDEAVIQEVARVVRPGGLLLCEQDCPPAGTSLAWTAEARLRKRRVGYTPEALQEMAAGVGLILETSQLLSGRIGRWWESIDGQIFRRSRTLHLALFPLARLLSWLSSPPPVKGEPGTVLYLFRKLRAPAPTMPLAATYSLGQRSSRLARD